MANSKLVILGLMSSLCVSACTTTTASKVGTEHRSAVENAVNKQIVSTTALKGAPTQHPQMSAAAVQRYLDDAVKPPEVTGGFSPEGGD